MIFVQLITVLWRQNACVRRCGAGLAARKEPAARYAHAGSRQLRSPRGRPPLVQRLPSTAQPTCTHGMAAARLGYHVRLCVQDMGGRVRPLAVEAGSRAPRARARRCAPGIAQLTTAAEPAAACSARGRRDMGAGMGSLNKHCRQRVGVPGRVARARACGWRRAGEVGRRAGKKMRVSVGARGASG